MTTFGVLIGALLAQSAPSNVPLDFRGYKLGMTLEEFRSRPNPPGWRGGATRATCTDSDRSQSWMMPSSDKVQVGVVGCGYVETIGSTTVRAGMPLSPLDHEATIEFYFFKGRLYRIETYMDF